MYIDTIKHFNTYLNAYMYKCARNMYRYKYYRNVSTFILTKRWILLPDLKAMPASFHRWPSAQLVPARCKGAQGYPVPAALRAVDLAQQETAMDHGCVPIIFPCFPIISHVFSPFFLGVPIFFPCFPIISQVLTIFPRCSHHFPMFSHHFPGSHHFS